MKILFFLSHPAQFLFTKITINTLLKEGHDIHILVKTKDILTNLLDEAGLKYHNILSKEREKSKFAIIRSLIVRDRKLLHYGLKNKIDLYIGTDASIAHVAFLLRKPSITILEDDYEVIKKLAKITYPFTKIILTPHVCDVGPYINKKIGYSGYMKLAYLHPNVFTPDISKITMVESGKPYFLIRLSSLAAHHDIGEKGVSDSLLDWIILTLEKRGNIYISSERTLKDKYSKYHLNIKLSDIHHYLYYADLLICDSQSMSVEASVLGTPSIRISSFVGRISVLEELQNKYNLTVGIKPDNEDKVKDKLKIILNSTNTKSISLKNREKMLEEKIDVSAFLTWFIHNYPISVSYLKSDKNIERQFKTKPN